MSSHSKIIKEQAEVDEIHRVLDTITDLIDTILPIGGALSV